MRAVVLHAKRDLRVETRNRPEPGRGEVLVRISNGGICGSDLHYFREGGFGAVRLLEPMVLGHELAGHVVELGEGVKAPATGTLVAINPAAACGQCHFCRAGQPIHCSDMRFFGSAMRVPHVQGGFADYVVCNAANAVAMPANVSPAKAAFVEPLAVCLHAAGQVPVYGRRVLIMGAGPIGILMVLAARFAGAREVVVTDILDKPLEFARAVGANQTINVATRPGALSSYEADKGYFDIVFEAAGQSQTIATALQILKPRGTIVIVGQGAFADFPVTSLVVKELMLRGSFRFSTEFALAAELIASGQIDVEPLLSAIFPVEDAEAAFILAGDKDKSMKVQLAFQ